MHPDIMKVGMTVVINEDIETTKELFGVNSVMRKMAGHPYQIDKITTENYVRAAIIKTYLWHPDDLRPVVFKKRPSKIVYFDIKELYT